MAHFVVTGKYTDTALKGLIAKPDDREAAARALFEAAGAKLLTYLVTTGESDFLIVVQTDDLQGVLSAMLVAGSTGSISNIKTALAYHGRIHCGAEKRLCRRGALQTAGQGSLTRHPSASPVLRRSTRAERMVRTASP